MTEQFHNFMQELNALLVKHNATINFTYDGDTHGTYDDRCYITLLHEKSHWSENVVGTTNDTHLDQYNTTLENINREWF